MLESGQQDQVRQFRQLFENEMTERLTPRWRSSPAGRSEEHGRRAGCRSRRRARWEHVSVPCSVAIHVLTGSGRLTPHAPRITRGVRTTAGACAERLPLEGGDIDIVVRDDPRRAIPEVGIGGFASDGHTVFIALDPGHERFDLALGQELARAVAHELYHVARRQASQRGRTLLDALVHEGLADHFSIELTGAEAPIWVQALTAEEAATLLRRAHEEYDDARYDHVAWFFGNDELGIPRWAGYTLGFKLVADYLERNPTAKASTLTSTPSATLRPPG